MDHKTYITTAIPYVNSAPHLGHALELVQADALARHQRLRGRSVRTLTGTDDNAAKNVTAALGARVPVETFVAANTAQFRQAAELLDTRFDDFIATSSDPRHAVGVEVLWEKTKAKDDFYQKNYTGLYCSGCEQFYAPADLQDGRCAEHNAPPEEVTEQNWFFALGRYKEKIQQLLEDDQVRITPASRKNEVLRALEDLPDISVSRPKVRSHGWGIPVPGDPDQVVYVWWDALANYVTALGYGSDEAAYQEWWEESTRRIHIIGKGITLFHAVHYLGILLSADLPLPTDIFVHDYLTVDGQKISKSLGNSVSIPELVEAHGADALRWWLLRGVSHTNTTDFTVTNLTSLHNQELANELGNLVNRTLSLVQKYREGSVTGTPLAHPLGELLHSVPGEVDTHLEVFDFRGAIKSLWKVVSGANQLVEAEKPWVLYKEECSGDSAARERLDAVLALLVETCRFLAVEISPYVPAGAAKLQEQLGQGTVVGKPEPAFPRLDR